LSKKSPHILCVNPWIHDFAAFDFWAKPLGLLQLAAIAREGGARVTFLDCLDRFHPRAVEQKRIKILSDGRGPFRKRSIPVPENLQKAVERFSSVKNFFRYGVEPEWFRDDLRNLAETGRPDLIMVTSLMTYWASGVQETISVIKEIFPDLPVVLGGIYATLCSDHARKNSMADRVVTGRGEEQLYDIIRSYTGFCLAVENQASPISVAFDRRSQFSPVNLDALPFPALDLISNLTYAPILTSRGCPFSCSYCASSFLEPQLRRRSPESVFEEICHWHEQYGVNNIAFYDDALLINPENYILPLLEKILQYSLTGKSHLASRQLLQNRTYVLNQSSSSLSFHTPNALHIRQITKDIADLMFRTGFLTIRLGLETTDFSISRREDIKVKEDEFYHAVAMLKQAGFKREQIGAYLLSALPGQNLDDLERSVALVKESGIMPVLAYYTPIPHTPMWRDALLHSPFDLENEPLLTNNALLPCLHNEHEIKKISELKRVAK